MCCLHPLATNLLTPSATDSAAFTDDVFQAVKYKSYLPGAPPAPPLVRQAPTAPAQAPKIPTGPAAQQQPSFAPPFEVHHTPYAETPSAFSSYAVRNGSRKRSYRDLDAPDPQSMNWDYGGPSHQQPHKQARRGGNFGSRGGRYEDPHSSRGRGGYGSYNGPPPNGPSANYPSAGYGGSFPGYDPNQPFAPQQPIDANSIIENIQRLQELGARMGIQMPGAPGAAPLPKPVYSGLTASTGTSKRRREPCRDYETKGFCSRGNSCQFEHGNASGFVPSFVAPPGDEYDPKNAGMGINEHSGQSMKPVDMVAPRMPPPNRHEKKSKRKGGRSAFSAEGASHDKTNTKIVVENIPEEKFAEDAVREFFKEFGTVEEVSLRPALNGQRRVAIVKFDNWAAANAAWKSPKVVFDNRFVKIYWYKDESQLGPNTKKGGGSKKGSANGDGAPAEPEFDLEEFKRKQEEAQKAHLEKQEKRDNLERERQELEEKRKELLARQEEEKRKLQAKLAANGVKEDSLSPILTKAVPDGAKPSQAEALRAKLAALEQEANSLGLDPDAAADDSAWPTRGRGRGRPYQGRGSYPPRGFRGGYGYRGRGGVGPDVHAAYAAYSLDNRPKIIAITGVDFTEPAKDEALRQYLFVSLPSARFQNECLY